MSHHRTANSQLDKQRKVTENFRKILDFFYFQKKKIEILIRLEPEFFANPAVLFMIFEKMADYLPCCHSSSMDDLKRSSKGV